MSTGDKSIILSIIKIHNWNQLSAEKDYILSFISKANGQLILQKQTKTSISNNQLILNTSLKISYTSDENKIVLIIEPERIKEKTKKFLKFQINLDLLAQNKVQFLPLQKNDKVLEVILGEIPQKPIPVIKKLKDQSRILNKDFIQQRYGYLKSFNSTNILPLDFLNPQQDQYVQKLLILLKQTRRIRESNKNQRFIKTICDQDDEPDPQLHLPLSLQNKSEKNSRLSMKSKLKLKNLVFIPGNIYDNLQQRKARSQNRSSERASQLVK